MDVTFAFFAAKTHFINPVTKMIYDPSASNILPTGPGTNALTSFNSQTYSLTSFLSGIQDPNSMGFKQECSDNADLLTIFANALGINAAPLFVANDANLAAPLAPTCSYVSAGTSVTNPGDIFRFHQFVLYGGAVFDPSTAPAVGPVLDPRPDTPLATYMANTFPTQGAYVRTTVSVNKID